MQQMARSYPMMVMNIQQMRMVLQDPSSNAGMPASYQILMGKILGLYDAFDEIGLLNLS
jgi:hypothetical protein